jgi:hypothetical protein
VNDNIIGWHRAVVARQVRVVWALCLRPIGPWHALSPAESRSIMAIA